MNCRIATTVGSDVCKTSRRDDLVLAIQCDLEIVFIRPRKIPFKNRNLHHQGSVGHGSMRTVNNFFFRLRSPASTLPN